MLDAFMAKAVESRKPQVAMPKFFGGCPLLAYTDILCKK